LDLRNRMALLNHIKTPKDIKSFTLEQLKQLAEEIRIFMIKKVSQTGGHLASSLGAVELTIALHRILNMPEDKIVWDVGHQTYAHKLLTGRCDRFHTLRQMQGISGFPKREESVYDSFNTGHSSTSISAALGLARARDLAGKKNKIVAVIGDGSLSNGLALEALNDAGHKQSDLLVILNDNRMSISRPVGGLSNYLNQIITGRIYNRLKEKVEGLLASIPAVGKTALGLTHYLEEIAKGLIVPGVLFEELGFRYLGPVNGHDLEQLLATLERVNTLSGPLLLHVITQKGKGFEHAEKDPETFHGAPKFNADTGECKGSSALTFSQAFALNLMKIAKKDKKIVAIVAAMTSGTALDEFAAAYPKRFFDVGIAESHAVTMAAGLAVGGYKPVVAVYSTFLQRAYDQIMHDVCLQNLPVIFALDRAGLVGEDGPTHHGVFDIAYLRHLPNMSIFAPSNEAELAGMLKTAFQHRGPIAIRYPRGVVNQDIESSGTTAIALGKARVVRRGSDAALLALGNMVNPAMAAAKTLETQGIHVTVIDPRSVKPLDEKIILSVVKTYPCVLTIEDHVLAGGFGSAVLELVRSKKISSDNIHCLGLPDTFIEQGTREELFSKYQLHAEGIKKRVLALVSAKAKTQKRRVQKKKK
jgi:1-deoxy-D-xylulose-5-phosphate synthase